MERNATLDHARLWAAFGIVYFHTGGAGTSIGYAALPFFLMVLIVLMFPSALRVPFGAFVRARAQRLLRPWLIWSAIYGGLKLVDMLVNAKPAMVEFQFWMVLTGPALPLWFLPFSFVISLAIWPIARLHLQGVQQVLLLVLLSVLALLFLAVGQQPLPIPLAQWVFVLPSACLGLGLAISREDPDRRLLVALIATGLVMVLALALGWTGGLLQLGLAVAALVLCLTLRLPSSPLSRFSAAMAFGVYLTHPLVASVLSRGMQLEPKTPLFAVCTILGALGLSVALSRTRLAMF